MIVLATFADALLHGCRHWLLKYVFAAESVTQVRVAVAQDPAG